MPFSVNSVVAAPEDYKVIIADSHIKASKSEKTKNTFNAKICCYNIALELLKSRCPEIADKVEYWETLPDSDETEKEGPA